MEVEVPEVAQAVSKHFYPGNGLPLFGARRCCDSVTQAARQRWAKDVKELWHTILLTERPQGFGAAKAQTMVTDPARVRR